MGLFGHEYKKKYDTQTSPINEAYAVPRSLNNLAYRYCRVKGADYSLLLREAQTNSIAGTLYKIAKDCQEGGKYASSIGTPKGTFIMKPLGLASFRTILNSTEPKQILSQKVSPVDDSVLFALAYDTLISLGFDGTHLTIEDIVYEFAEVSLGDDNFIYVDYYEVEMVQHGPTSEVIKRPFTFNTGIHLDDTSSDYVVIKYLNQEDEIKYYVYNTASNSSEIITSWIKQNHVSHYPSFFARYDKESIRTKDPSYFKTCVKALKRLNLDWEDLVDNYNGDAQLRNKDPKDDDYKDNIKNVTDIALIFALDVTTNDQRVMRYLYELFKFMYESSGLNSNKISYRHKAFDYDCSWDSIIYEKKQGTIAKFHRFTTEGFEEIREVTQTVWVTPTSYGAPHQEEIKTKKKVPVLRIRRQINPYEFEELKVVNFVYTSYNNGKGMSRSVPSFSNLKPYTAKDIAKLKTDEIDEETSECLVPVLPVIIKTRIGNIIGGDILSIAMRSVHNTYVKIKKKWYQTKWFSIIRYIVSAVIIVCSFGTATPLVVLANIAINILILLAIKLAIKVLCKIFHLKALEQILSLVVDLVAIFCYGVPPAACSISTSLAAGQLDLNSLLSNIASAQLTAAGFPMAAIAFQIAQDPSFYQALENKDWGTVAMKIGPLVMSAIATAMPDTRAVDSMGKLQQTKGSLLDPITKQVDYTKIDFKPINSAITFKEQLEFVGKELGKVPLGIIKDREERYKVASEKLRNNMLTLSNQMNVFNQKASSALAFNNSMNLAFIVDEMNKDDDLDFYRFNRGFV